MVTKNSKGPGVRVWGVRFDRRVLGKFLGSPLEFPARILNCRHGGQNDNGPLGASAWLAVRAME